MKVLTLKFNGETTEVHTLNVGDVFEGFGGSRHPLVAGRDWASGQKHKKPTASLVLRRESAMGTEDKERDIHDPQFWAWIARLINATPDGYTAEAEG
jgi:hypothetical protein